MESTRVERTPECRKPGRVDSPRGQVHQVQGCSEASGGRSEVFRPLRGCSEAGEHGRPAGWAPWLLSFVDCRLDGAPESRAADPARTRPSSPQRPSVHPARGRIRNRHNHRLLNTFALAAPAPTLDHTVRAASAKASALLDGTPLPVDRIAADSPFHSGQTQETRDGRAGRCGSVRRAAVGVTRSATMSVQPASMVSSTLPQRPTSPSGLARDAKEPRARSVFPAAASAPPPLTQDALPPHYTEVMLPPEFSLPDSERRFSRPRHQLQAVCPTRIAATAIAANRTQFQVMATIAL